MRLVRVFPLLVAAVSLAGCDGGIFVRGDKSAGKGEVVGKLDTAERPPEIVPLPPPPLEPVAAPAPTTALAAAKPETTVRAAPEPFEDTVVPPRRSKPSAKAKHERGAHAKTYTVQRGDTLQKISQRFYGTTRSWQRIYEANRGKLKKPDMIVVGMVLKIP